MLLKKNRTFLVLCQDNQSLALIALALFLLHTENGGTSVLPFVLNKVLPMPPLVFCHPEYFQKKGFHKQVKNCQNTEEKGGEKFKFCNVAHSSKRF